MTTFNLQALCWKCLKPHNQGSRAAILCVKCLESERVRLQEKENAPIGYTSSPDSFETNTDHFVGNRPIKNQLHDSVQRRKNLKPLLEDDS